LLTVEPSDVVDEGELLASPQGVLAYIQSDPDSQAGMTNRVIAQERATCFSVTYPAQPAREWCFAEGGILVLFDGDVPRNWRLYPSRGRLGF